MTTVYALIEHVDQSSSLMCVFQDLAHARRIALAQAEYRRAQLRIMDGLAVRKDKTDDYTIVRTDTARGAKLTLVQKSSGHVDQMSWDLETHPLIWPGTDSATTTADTISGRVR